MSNTSINPIAFSSAIAAGGIGASVAEKAKPIAEKVTNMTAPVVDTFSISAKKAVTVTENGLGKLSSFLGNLFADLGNIAIKGVKDLKNLFYDMKNKVNLPKISDMFSNTAKASAKFLKSPAFVAGIIAGSLYAGYKIVSSHREDK